MSLRRHFLGGFILQVPNTIFVHCSRRRRPTHDGLATGPKRLDAHLKSNHVKEQVRIIGTVNASKGVIPVKCCHTTRKAILDIPENSPSEINIPLQQPHAAIPRPASLVTIPHGILIVWIRVLNKVTLNQVFGLLAIEFEQHVNLVHVTSVKTNGMADFCFHISKSQVFIRTLRCAGQFTCTSESKDEQVKNEPIILHNERRELKATNQPIRVCVHHVLVADGHIVLGRHVVSNVVINNQTQKTVQERQVDLFIHLFKL
mmetsp:Transcript_46/g.74  ORF Transcript_46/g.74 Transcript_46/m.74 type:complete len:259 (-) Transcript_46:3765-4541(-)